MPLSFRNAGASSGRRSGSPRPRSPAERQGYFDGTLGTEDDGVPVPGGVEVTGDSMAKRQAQGMKCLPDLNATVELLKRMTVPSPTTGDTVTCQAGELAAVVYRSNDHIIATVSDMATGSPKAFLDLRLSRIGVDFRLTKGLTQGV